MNILIIDDMTVPEKNSANSRGKEVFFRLSEENLCRRLFLAKEFSGLGANVLLARMEILSGEEDFPFDYRESGGISQVFVPVKKRKGSSILKIAEKLDFSGVLSDNFKSLSGLFKPDVVICCGVLPFFFGAGAKIAKSAGSLLITELSCSPAEFLRRAGLCSFSNPVLLLLKRLMEGIFKKSDCIIGLFPNFINSSSKRRGVFSLEYSSFLPETAQTEETAAKKEILSAFGGGNTFVLACPNPLEEGFSVLELMEVSGELGNKFALVFTGEGKRKNDFKKLVSEKGYTNVFFMEEVLPAEEAFVLSAADGIFLSENLFEKGLASDSKRIFSAFGAGRPVVAAAQFSAEIFRRSGGSIITKPKNKESFRLGIKTLMELSENERSILGTANKSFAEKNSAKNFAADYFSLIENLFNQKESKK